MNPLRSIVPFFSHQARQQHRSLSGIDKVAENKISEWLHNRGDESLKKKGELLTDRHKQLSRSLGVHYDYVHSKILADNNIKPESIQRRIDLDTAWNDVKFEIQEVYKNGTLTVDEFVKARSTAETFGEEINRLDKMAKSLNDAIISDSMRFNGRSPVKHARRFTLEERIKEAIES
jgi:hypothetical protein